MAPTVATFGSRITSATISKPAEPAIALNFNQLWCIPFFRGTRIQDGLTLQMSRAPSPLSGASAPFAC
jgi:hypothetical protein